VGRAVFGTIKIIEDLIQSGKSILLLGRPGVGKTTMLRELARVLADDMNKRVIIVDTSNEIAGDGDIPHPAIGHARRMQVTAPTEQHAVMIEAVENHMPEVIIIDEIGTELEAKAARTIAERGVQLIGTAHGNTLENLMINPTLCDLIGGIQTVILGDEEAKRRGTQKSILERTSPPTFDIVVEIQDWDNVAIHPNVSESVDAILRNLPVATDIRRLNKSGKVTSTREAPATTSQKSAKENKSPKKRRQLKLYLFGLNHGRLKQVAQGMELPLEIVNDLASANIFITSKNYYHRRSQKVREAEIIGLPIYVLKSSTTIQIRQLLNDIHATKNLVKSRLLELALSETEDAADLIKNGQQGVKISPQNAYIRRLQHLLARRHELQS
jgi:energy-coupling factor transporter ATP-binding protein EcfA2